MNEEIEKNVYNFIEKPLIEHGLGLVHKESYNLALTVTYFYPINIKIRFTYEYVDMLFVFYIYTFKSEYVYKEKMFWKIFMEMDPSVKYEDIQPVGREYLPALQRNSELLERFLDLVFKQGKTELIQELFE
jgi:hypothetical protein